LPSAEEPYSAALVVEVAKPERDPGGVLDQSVGAFGTADTSGPVVAAADRHRTAVQLGHRDRAVTESV
jgi:hypothetical protein